MSSKVLLTLTNTHRPPVDFRAFPEQTEIDVAHHRRGRVPSKTSKNTQAKQQHQHTKTGPLAQQRKSKKGKTKHRVAFSGTQHRDTHEFCCLLFSTSSHSFKTWIGFRVTLGPLTSSCHPPWMRRHGGVRWSLCADRAHGCPSSGGDPCAIARASCARCPYWHT